jgi:hypothetical protein
MASGVTVTFDGKEYPLDDFELGELEFIEDHIGGSLEDERALSSMKAMIAFVTVIKRREDPAFTVDDARKLKLAQVDQDPEPEKAGAAKRPPKRRAAAA